jgi:hypothetical protein
VLIFFCQAYAPYATLPELEIHRSIAPAIFSFGT